MRSIEAKDFDFRACSIWVAPDGVQYLELAHWIVLPLAVPAGAMLQTQQSPAHPKYSFVLNQISLSQQEGSDVYARFQWPNGHFSSQRTENLTEFYGIGQYSVLEDPEIVMPPGSVIRTVQVQNPGEVDAVLYIVFEGVLRIPMVAN